jgi:hypothetical protein
MPGDCSQERAALLGKNVNFPSQVLNEVTKPFNARGTSNEQLDTWEALLQTRELRHQLPKAKGRVDDCPSFNAGLDH